MDHAPLALNSFPGGGSLEGLKVSYALPCQRVYGTGAGTDESVVTAIAEDLSQVTGSMDPPILRETAYSDTDAATVENLKPKVLSILNADKRTVMQLTGSIDVNDTDTAGRPMHPLGSFWPGQSCEVSVTGHRTLPDGTYSTRLMEMSGDQSSKVSLKFDVMNAPF
jgi:hypothetical protein